MKLQSVALAMFLHWRLSNSLTLEPRDDKHDRGIWQLDCSKAPGACNNACFSIFCLKQDTKKMYYDAAKNNVANRKKSGCDAGKSICNASPFSQKLNDPQNLKKPTCDEWPMAEVKQDKSTPPNVLRCIENPENSSGGSQLRNFIENNGKQPKRKGDGKCGTDDYWEVDFVNVDANASPYCVTNPNCANDGFQFYLTKNQGNKVSKTYRYDADNHYALSATITNQDDDIARCSVDLTRTSTGASFKYEAEVFDYTGKSKDKQQASSPTQGNALSLNGITPQISIWGKGNGETFKDEVNYKAGNVEWTSNKEGFGGKYCDDKGQGKETCYFPCFVK